MLDASSSSDEDGFAILREFTAHMMMKYQAEYPDADAMKIGLAVVGNGELNCIKE